MRLRAVLIISVCLWTLWAEQQVLAQDSQEARSVVIGFTTTPFDFTKSAREYTFRKIRAHGELIALHLDSGVPWPEALEGSDRYHPNLLDNLQKTALEFGNHRYKYVSTTAQDKNRLTLAPYWGADDGLALPGKWRGRNFDHPEVVAAYLNWCRFLLRTFQPDYFNYGIEVNNAFAGTRDKRFIRYRKLVSQVYPVLKAEFPHVKLLLEFQDHSLIQPKAKIIEVARALLPYTDLIGVSTYPYFKYSGVKRIPGSWLKELASLDPQKALAITETGYPAELLDVRSAGIYFEGDPASQAAYVKRLHRIVSSLRAEFVLWWQVRDNDQAARTFTKLGLGDAAKLWRDTGLYDGRGRARPALREWEKFRQRPLLGMDSSQDNLHNFK